MLHFSSAINPPILSKSSVQSQIFSAYQSAQNAASAYTKNFKAAKVEESECIIAVMGATGTGKTSFINMANGGDLRVGSHLHSCTSEVQIASRFVLDGRSVTLIDTPGFDDTTKSDAEILRMIAAFLAAGYEHGQKLAGVIYIHRISDFRMTGISSRNFKMFRELCGDSTLRNVVILTNMWGSIPQEVGESRELELRTRFFKAVLDKGATLLRHENTPESALKVLRHIIKNKPVTLQIQRELVEEKKDISETAAGAELNRELLEQMKKHEKEVSEMKEDLEAAIKAKDEESRQELEEATAKLEEEIQQFQQESHNLAFEYKQDKARMERQMQEMMEAARLEAVKVAKEYEKQLTSLRNQLEKTSLDATEERAQFEARIANLERNMNRGWGCCIQ